MEDHRDGSGFGVQPQLEVTDIVGCPSESPCYVAVVTHRVTLERLVTHMTYSGSAVCPPVLSSHPHGLRVGKHPLNFGLFFLQCLQKERISSRYCSCCDVPSATTSDLKDLCRGIGSNSSSRAFLFLSFALRGGGEGRYFPGCKGFNKRALTESEMGSSRMFFTTSWRVDWLSGISASNCSMYSSIVTKLGGYMQVITSV